MTTYEHGEVTTIDVQYELAIVALVLVDRNIGLSKIAQDVAQKSNGHVCDGIYLGLREFHTLGVMLAQLGIGIYLVQSGNCIVRHDYLHLI
jgi:hypothetical protein